MQLRTKLYSRFQNNMYHNWWGNKSWKPSWNLDSRSAWNEAIIVDLYPLPIPTHNARSTTDGFSLLPLFYRERKNPLSKLENQDGELREKSPAKKNLTTFVQPRYEPLIVRCVPRNRTFGIATSSIAASCFLGRAVEPLNRSRCEEEKLVQFNHFEGLEEEKKRKRNCGNQEEKEKGQRQKKTLHFCVHCILPGRIRRTKDFFSFSVRKVRLSTEVEQVSGRNWNQNMEGNRSIERGRKGNVILSTFAGIFGNRWANLDVARSPDFEKWHSFLSRA